MYPYIRIAKELWKFRRSPRLSILEPHISTHRVWPWDLDPWRELNNGRTLTLNELTGSGSVTNTLAGFDAPAFDV